jgi:hypothetical protein
MDYRCPKCYNPDHIAIEAILTVRINSTGGLVDVDVSNWGPENWTSEKQRLPLFRHGQGLRGERIDGPAYPP